jgi:hypothetical protein
VLFGEFLATRSIFEGYKQQDQQSRRRERYCKAQANIAARNDAADGEAKKAEPGEDRQYELCQQWRSAEAAEDSAIVAWFQFGVAGAALIGVAIATYFAGGAYWAARRRAAQSSHSSGYTTSPSASTGAVGQPCAAMFRARSALL